MSGTRRVTEETVELLRQNGSPPELVEFAARHVARFSKAEMDAEWVRGFWMALIPSFLAAVVVILAYQS